MDDQHELGGTDAPLGAWHGVSVNTEGRVTGLRLERNNLTGTLPEALGNLANLQWLDLGNNQLSGPIPEALSNLLSLRVLSLTPNPGLHGCLSPDLQDWLAEISQSIPLSRCLLRDLQLSGTILDPPFAADTIAYTAAVAGPVATVVVTATLADASATVTIRKGGQAYANGAAVPIARRTNLITIEATPADGPPSQIITVRVTRPATDPITLDLRAGGDFVAIPAGAATTAVQLFAGTDVTSAWQYNRTTRTWDLAYPPRPGRNGLTITGSDVL